MKTWLIIAVMSSSLSPRFWKIPSRSIFPHFSVYLDFLSQKITLWIMQPQELIFLIYLSNMAYTSDEGWWMVQMMVLPWAANCCSAVTKLWAMNESRPDVGSSANSSGGSVMTWWITTTQHESVCYSYTILLSGIQWNQRLVCIPGKYKWHVKYSIVYTQERVTN